MNLWPKHLDDRNWLLGVVSVWAALESAVVVCSWFDGRHGHKGVMEHQIVDFLGWTVAAAGSLLIAIICVRGLRIDMGLVPTREGSLQEPIRPCDPRVLFSTAGVAGFAVGALAMLGLAVFSLADPVLDAVAWFAAAPTGRACIAVCLAATLVIWRTVFIVYARTYQAGAGAKTS